MRLGKPLEHLQAALKASQSAGLSQRSLERFTAIARQLSYAGYLTLDGVVWANSIKFIHLQADKADKTLKASLRFWFVGIIFGLGNGLLKVGTSHFCNFEWSLNVRFSRSDGSRMRLRL
jgi:peroxin-11B